jgi:ferredoxin
MKTIIFYFSGTGNSMYIAKRISVLDPKHVTFASILQYDRYCLNEYDKVGFVLPVYYLHIPTICIETIEKISLQHQSLFFIACYAGNPGFIFEDFRNISALKNNTIQEFKVRMPGNYILEYGAYSKATQERILLKANKEIESIYQDIQLNTVIKPKKTNVISKLYKQKACKGVASFSSLGEQFYTTCACNKCQQCIRCCPASNISLDANSITWYSKCTQCMRCIQTCPKNAIGHPAIKKSRDRYFNPYIDIKEDT